MEKRSKINISILFLILFTVFWFGCRVEPDFEELFQVSEFETFFQLSAEPKNDGAKLKATQFICSGAHYGRFNNVLDETVTGLLIAYLLNRSFVVSKEMTRVYEVAGWENIFQDKEYQVVILESELSSQEFKECLKTGVRISELSKKLSSWETRKKLIKSINGAKYIKIGSRAEFS
eukprot:snap_masked-scaffold_7-processed-gene-9.36-mRNA-1 protein AED:1.00 eAED:1.00 QI:0/0/0/0/1/1/2/0/175